MAKNFQPRFTVNGNPGSDGSTGMAPTFTTAAADYTGATATHNKQVFKANATNGSRLAGLRFKPIGTNVQSLGRIFLNNGSTNTTAANNSFVGEQNLPASTASNSSASADIDWYFPGGYIDLPPGWGIFVGLGTTVAAGWVVTPILGGDF